MSSASIVANREIRSGTMLKRTSVSFFNMWRNRLMAKSQYEMLFLLAGSSLKG
jgi:hypothetical protein